MINKYLKTSFILLSSLMSTASIADDFCSNYKELILSGSSYHFTSRTPYAKSNGYNSFNYGVGFNCSANKFGSWVDEMQIGIISNSFREASPMVSYGFLYPVFDKVKLGVKAIVAGGYQDAPTNFNGFIASPLLSTKIDLTDNTSLNISLIPSMTTSSSYIDGFIYGNLGFKF